VKDELSKSIDGNRFNESLNASWKLELECHANCHSALETIEGDAREEPLPVSYQVKYQFSQSI
jgi:hypothetical protein